ncbi:MAG: hypothetical protein K2Y26_06310, partial [Gemmatimonadaceae bacterium]|nr:hypothetical protein [Gemmatimonadaceae bacterium]
SSSVEPSILRRDTELWLIHRISDTLMVYLHCRSGIGRTGTMLALHMVRHGFSPSNALRRLEAAWRRDARSEVWPRCPQTQGQRSYILASDI